MTTQLMRRLERQGNITQQEGKATQLFTQGSHFSKKKELPRLGFKPITFCVLERCSYPLSYRCTCAMCSPNVHEHAHSTLEETIIRKCNSNLRDRQNGCHMTLYMYVHVRIYTGVHVPSHSQAFLPHAQFHVWPLTPAGQIIAWKESLGTRLCTGST